MSPIQQMFLGVGAVAEKTYVDDIFSTFLYTGTGGNEIIQNDIAIGSSMAGNSINLSDTSEAERLTRTSALSGVSASKTFTVSAWVFIPNTGTYGQLFYVDTGSQTRFELGFGNYIQIAARNGSNTKFLDVYTASNVPITPGQWNHILVSMDLTNTSNRHVYVNDSSVSMTYDSYGNEDILFNESKVSIFGQDDNNSKLFGHLSNFYFDQTYRNLGTTSNRRLFYAADGTPATGQASLSPIIYYSFDTLSTTNAGSGGDFTFVDSPTLGTFAPYKDTSAANGGLVWIKNRDTTGYGHFFFDTERGTTKALISNGTNAEFTEAKGVKDFNVNGFTIGGASGDAAFNGNNTDYSSFTFRKAPGFFDCIKFTGTGGTSSSPQSISHSLGSIPGIIIIKNLTQASQWFVYHKSTGVDKFLQLNKSDAAVGYNGGFSNITSSSFNVFDSNSTNTNEFIAYVFAGGESDAATARSVDFDGSDDDLATTLSTAPGTSDFTLEYWAKQDTLTNWQTHFATTRGNGFNVGTDGSGDFVFFTSLGGGRTIEKIGVVPIGQWNHWAFVRTGGVTTGYLNGVAQGSFSDSYNYTPTAAKIGNLVSGNEYTNGSISNLRLVVGTAVYTSSFRPPTEPLTSITNTVLLCCNDSSVTGKTTGGTITANGNPTASTDSPFDDPAGFKFGESGSESVIKTSSYVGTGSAGIEVNIGFEPQLILVKSTASGENWEIYDSMRGIVDGLNQSDRRLRPNTSDAEDDNPGFFSLRPNGFIVNGTSGSVNSSGVTFVFLAIRRPDGYVGKPPELGTDVFAMDTGASSSTIPNFDSGFPVDFGIDRDVTQNRNWDVGARLMQGKYLDTNLSGSGGNWAANSFDSNVGWNHSGANSNTQSWMWKRHAGMDVIFYEGDGVNGRSIAHSMNDVPEMMIVKRRSSTEDWTVYHAGLTSVNYHLTLNSSGAEVDMSSTPEKVWKSTPTATHFEIGSHDRVNTDGEDYLALLFSSIKGISKLGHYSGSSSDFSIDLGFTPRLWISKRVNGDAGGWIVFDTLRGMSSSVNDPMMFLNSTTASNAYSSNSMDISGNTITLKAGVNNDTLSSSSSDKYIYYAHA